MYGAILSSTAAFRADASVRRPSRCSPFIDGSARFASRYTWLRRSAGQPSSPAFYAPMPSMQDEALRFRKPKLPFSRSTRVEQSGELHLLVFHCCFSAYLPVSVTRACPLCYASQNSIILLGSQTQHNSTRDVLRERRPECGISSPEKGRLTMKITCLPSA